MITMKSMKVKLNSIEKIRDFVSLVSLYPSHEFDLVSDRYVVNAKSIMGIFSLDQSADTELIIHGEECPELLEKLSAFEVKE